MTGSPGRSGAAGRIGLSALNLLVLRWLGLRLARVEDPGRGRVWVRARRSLSRAETITTDDVDLASARPVRRWELRRERPILGRLAPALGALLVLGAIVARVVRSDGEATPGRTTLAVARTPGEDARRSRCGECAQPGDAIVATTRGPGFPGGIRVYRGGTPAPVVSCAGCSSLSFLIPSVGRYLVVGVGMPTGDPCPLDDVGADGDLARLAACGAEIATSEIEAR